MPDYVQAFPQSFTIRVMDSCATFQVESEAGDAEEKAVFRGQTTRKLSSLQLSLCGCYG
jgi:hypothetical protein